MTVYFITGTGTGIGKTLVTSALAWQLQQAGKKVAAIKPVVSGYNDSDFHAADPALLLDSLGIPVSKDTIHRISPWRFAAAVSPHLAARGEGCQVVLKDVLQFCRRQHTAADILLVEGAGGVMTPLNDQATMLDWMAALEVPVIVVAGTYLGALSHALTALEALHTRKLAIAGVVINESEPAAMPLAEAAACLKQFTAPNISVITVPRLKVTEQAYKHMSSLMELCSH